MARAAATAWVVTCAALAAGAQGAAPLYSGKGFSVSVTPFVEGGLSKVKAELLLDSNVLKCGDGTKNCDYIAVGFGRSNSMVGSKALACFTTTSPKQLCPTDYAAAPLCLTQSNGLQSEFSSVGNVLSCNITIDPSVGGTDFTQGTVNVLYSIGTGDAPDKMAFHDYKGNTQTFTNAGSSTERPTSSGTTSGNPTTQTPTTPTPQTTTPSTPSTPTPTNLNHASGLSASIMLGLVTALLGASIF
jgi:hypothetical protein